MDEIVLQTAISDMVFTIKLFFISMCTYFTNIRIINNKVIPTKRVLLNILIIFLTALMCNIMKSISTYFISITFLILILSIHFS